MLLRLMSCVAFLTFILGGFSGCSSKVVATVNGKDIGEQEFVGQMIAIHGHGMETLEWLIEYHLLMDELQRKKMTISEKEIDERIRADQKRAGQDPAAWQQAMRASGITLEDVRREKRYELALQKLVTEGIKVTDEQVQKIYQDNPNYFQLPPRLQFARIRLRTKQEADQIYKRLGEGGQFTDLVKEHSLDGPEIRESGGVLGPPLPVNEWPQEYLQAAQKVAKNSPTPLNIPTPPFKQGDFWLIVKVVKEIKPEKVRFEEVKDFLHDQEAMRKASEQGRTAATVLQELARKARVAIKEHRLMPLENQLPSRIAGKFGGLPPSSSVPSPTPTPSPGGGKGG